MSAKYYTQFKLTDGDYHGGNEFSGVVELSRPMDQNSDVTDIEADARVHYHKKLSEVYLVLEGEGQMELDGELVPVKPMTAVFLKPLCRHRAIGKMRMAITVIPAFDPEDEWFD